MLIEKIKLTGFMSYVEEEVDLRKGRTTLVAGDNGSGKSALLESVPFCFWGIGRGKTLSDYINDDHDTLRIEVTFLMDGARYRKVRQHGKSGNINELYIDRNNANKLEDAKWRLISDDTKRKTDELLTNILGLDYDIFSNSVFLGQKEASSFVEGEASDRKELLCNLLGIQIYEEAEELVKKSAKETDSRIQTKSIVLNDKLLVAQQRVKLETDIAQVVKQISDCQKNIKALQKKQVELQANRDKLRLDISNREKNEQQLKDIKKQIESGKSTLSTYQTDLKNIVADIESTIDEGIEVIEGLQKTIDSEPNLLESKGKHEESLALIEREKSKLPKLKEKLTAQRDSKEMLLQRRSEIAASIKVLDDRQKKIEKAGPICPVIDEPCDKLSEASKQKMVDSIAKDRSKREVNLSQVATDLTAASESIIEIDGQIEAVVKRTEREALITSKLVVVKSELEQVKSSKEKLPQAKTKYRAKVDKLTESKEGLEKRTEKVKETLIDLESRASAINATLSTDLEGELAKVVRSINAIESDIEDTTKSMNSLSVQSGALNEKLQQAKLADEDAKAIQSEIDQLGESLRIDSELAFSFGKNGLQKDIINDNVPLLEEKTNELLSKFTKSSQLQVRFDLDPVTKSGKLKKQGGLDIVIFQKGHQPRLLNMYSGGETVRIVFAILLALSYLLTKRAGKRSQTLIIDERIAALDQEGINQFIEVVNYIAEQYKKILIVSHISELKESFVNVINIRKTASGSKVV